MRRNYSFGGALVAGRIHQRPSKFRRVIFAPPRDDQIIIAVVCSNTKRAQNTNTNEYQSSIDRLRPLPHQRHLSTADSRLVGPFFPGVFFVRGQRVNLTGRTRGDVADPSSFEALLANETERRGRSDGHSAAAARRTTQTRRGIFITGCHAALNAARQALLYTMRPLW